MIASEIQRKKSLSKRMPWPIVSKAVLRSKRARADTMTLLCTDDHFALSQAQFFYCGLVDVINLVQKVSFSLNNF